MIPRKPNTHGGGAKTNKTGLSFEQETDLKTYLISQAFCVDTHGMVSKDNIFWGYLVPKYDLYTKFLQPRKIDYKKVISRRLLPDEAFINEQNKVAYIIEKKHQTQDGSVDEKLAVCEFKRQEYEKLLNPLGYTVVFIFLLSEWFYTRQEKYRDILEYVHSKQVPIFYFQVEIAALGLASNEHTIS